MIRQWHLFWVTSDGEEDCFVVAKNSRSAKSVEFNACGLDWGEIHAERVCAIPEAAEAEFFQRATDEDRSLRNWPGYAQRELLELLEAEFRWIDGVEFMMLEDVVYEVTSDGFVRVREVGQRAIESAQTLAEELAENEIHVLSPKVEQAPLLLEIGSCVVQCQRVESLMAHSVILGIKEAKTQGYKTVADLISAWEKKTLGAMLRCIEQAYTIEPTVHTCLKGFVSMRNELIHSITTKDRFDIETEWGRRELWAFLVSFRHFIALCEAVFSSTVLASYDFLHCYSGELELSTISFPLSSEDSQRTWRFHAYFTPKHGEGAW